MSNPTFFKDRFTEVAACAALDMQVAQLTRLNRDATGKQWAKQREQRRAIWQEIAATARGQADMLGEPVAVKRRAPAAKCKAAVAVEPPPLAASSLPATA